MKVLFVNLVYGTGSTGKIIAAKAEAVRRNLLMNVLITGANGFVGKNLTQRLSTIKDRRDRTRPALQIEEILLCTRDTSAETLAGYCQKADFVVHLAGVNRPQDPGEFAAGNTDFTRTLLEMLRKSGNRCPVLLSSSVQASLTGRYAGSPYGQSKKAAEELLLAYGEETGAAGMIYRLPNLFGKWCRPNYNSAVATFCHHIAREEPITVSDPAVELELVYIDDLIDEILDAMEGQPHRTDGAYCSVPVFELEGYHFFTMGGAKSHDTEDGILEPGAPDFERKLLMLQRKPRARYRINHISWWAQEMPSEEEYAEARRNLTKVDWAVDYVITHCAPTSIALIENRHNEADPLTDFLQEVKERAHYHYWLFGHYHDNRAIDEKHILLWEQIIQVI